MYAAAPEDGAEMGLLGAGQQAGVLHVAAQTNDPTSPAFSPGLLPLTL